MFSLSRRDADIVVSVSRPPAGRLIVSKLIDYDLGLYAAPAYLAAHPPIAAPPTSPRTASSAISASCSISRSSTSSSTSRPAARPRSRAATCVAQLRATLAGAGLCVLPAFLAGEEEGLVRVLPDEVSLTRSLWLIVHQDLAELARVKAVVRFIKDEVAAARATFRLD